ncbi:GNAT family N-acetyltransferase [Streptomyces sp. AK02-04a]|uniref:GNAT family N-acetyltransferase n=1 Tax=Streptomyces sp. AK02-04a TaxID=3028649 RepID=UPI0029ADE9C2|nr:GNAT family N-acetyltransferase [Streptomyces sp. AK02-04a]MDX3762788.1 GNAT family N-acetyltransferase [Streptomyces sp. AK02-04a]
MALDFCAAAENDIDGLLRLYRRVYGPTYALPLGTDPQVMAREIASPLTTWLVAKEQGTGRVVGSILGTIDPGSRLGKLQGLVLHPGVRGSGAGHQAVRQLAEKLLSGDQPADSVYATARTVALAPQRICLRSGFHALGVFPNLRKAAHHETMVLLARHRPEVLEQRLPVAQVPVELAGLIRALEAAGFPTDTEFVTEPLPQVYARHMPERDVELLDAPEFVLRRFAEAVPDPALHFYPFHAPNVMLAATDGAYEVYAQLSRSDGYCTLIGTVPGFAAAGADLEFLIRRLGDYGASYIETLVPLDCLQELRQLLAHGFLPAAAYPAMRRVGPGFHDYVVMARTLEPLDFRGLSIDAAFKPFTEQYIELWKQRYLNTHGIFQ